MEAAAPRMFGSSRNGQGLTRLTFPLNLAPFREAPMFLLFFSPCSFSFLHPPPPQKDSNNQLYTVHFLDSVIDCIGGPVSRLLLIISRSLSQTIRIIQGQTDK